MTSVKHTASIKNMTSGSPLRLLVSFALPLMIGNVFQELYTMVDSMVVGKVLGLSALAAVGNGEWLSWLVTSMVQGVAQGFSIRLAQDFGAEDEAHLKKTYAASRRLSAVCAGVILCFALLALRPILRLMHTPPEIFPIRYKNETPPIAATPVIF